MTDAYKCDRCGEYHRHDPSASLTDNETVASERDLCKDCREIVVNVIKKRYNVVKRDDEHYAAPKDEYGDPEGI